VADTTKTEKSPPPTLLTVTTDATIYYGDRCAYCGDLASEIDHVIPRSALHSRKWEFVRHNCVPSCFTCNNVASDWVFASIGEKRRYILIWRFIGREEAREFRELVKAWRGRCHAA
jgi:5-methylcytosine-specific restriction endonuclease McrA